MKLHWSPRSPFVRKVMISAHELGLVDRLDCVRTVAATVKPHAELMLDNPLSKIPTLILDDGSPLYDSVVICEYLDNLDGRQRLFPADPARRRLALRRHALANGFLDLSVLRRNERDRPAELRSQPHLAAFATKTTATLAAFEKEAPTYDTTTLDIGAITTGIALSYLDFRFADEPWRPTHPALATWHAGFAARPSVIATHPIDA